MRWPSLPVGRQITLAIAAVSGTALLLASIAFIAYDRVTFSDTMVRRLSGEAEIVGFNAATAILFEDPESAATTLAALRADLPVVSAAIYTTDGRLFATYERGAGQAEPPAPQLPPGAAAGGHLLEGSRLVVSRPIVFEGTPVGTVVIRSDLSERGDRLRRYAGMVAVVSLGALAVALLLGSGAQRVITGPLLQLSAAARGVSERGDFSRRVPRVQRADELGVLVTAFNHMLEGLERRDGQLREAHAELQRRLDERTELYRQASEANRLKDEFLATLSHELRTPLNAIVGWTALLVQGDLDEDTHERAVAAIDRNARAQSKLVEDVLDVSRIVSGKLALRVQPVELPVLVQAAVDAVSHAAAARHIAIHVEMEEGLDRIVADPDRLQQVLWNLLSNAIKFTEREGNVWVRVARAAGNVELSVRDDGIGIAPDFLAHVFERFRQADGSTTRAHGGLGLGLAIVRHVVEMHGGTVRAESAGRGQGATFTVTLPPAPLAAAGEERRAPGAAARQLEPDLTGLAVLAVGGGEEERELARVALVARGAAVRTVDSAGDAVGAVRERVPDVVVSCLDPVSESVEDLVGSLRALPADRGGNVPAVALIPQARAEDRARLLLAGYQACLTRPVNPLEMAALVAAVTGARVRS